MSGPRTPRHRPGKRDSFPVVKSVSLTDAQALKLARLANKRRSTASAVIRELLEEAKL